MLGKNFYNSASYGRTYHTSDGSANQSEGATDEAATLSTSGRSHHWGDNDDTDCSDSTADDIPHASCQSLTKIFWTCLLQYSVQLLLGFLLFLELLLPGLFLLCFVVIAHCLDRLF